ncbi:ABC transporter permease [Gordonia westfalica]|uniref:ABC transporter permease n=1 Tax=Gordonia westfalica TaxID=158898 RepID=UPI0013566734|nr:ABC transporter permease subunit [Gordonia westfalica]
MTRFRPADLILEVAGIGLVMLFWYAATLVTTRSQVPTIGQTLSAIQDGWNGIPAVQFFDFSTGGIKSALVFTTVHVVAGVGVGSIAGLLVGVILAVFPVFRSYAQPVLIVAGTVPLMVLLPFLLIWFGTSTFAQTGLVVVSAFITVAVSVQSSAMTVMGQYANYARTLGASETTVVTRVMLPAIVPNAMSAIRVSLAAGWGWQCVAELVGGNNGAGRIIKATANIGAVDAIFAMLLCVVVTALLVDGAVTTLGKLLTRWQA